jgi:tetratricopeptide (TPR) repeat protein
MRARAAVSYGLSLLTARRLDEAIAVLAPAYAELQRTDKSGGPWIGNAASTYGNALVLAGQVSDAERVLNENLTRGESIGPALGDTHTGLGFVALSRRDFAAAKSNFDKAHALAANAPPSRVVVNALLGRGLTQFESGDLDGADTSLRDAEVAQTKLVVRPTPVLMEITSARGRLALAKGNREEAAALFARVDQFWQAFGPGSPQAAEASQWRQRMRGQ